MLDHLRSALDRSPSHEPPAGDRLAAVLAPLIFDGEPSLLFTRRHEDMSRHPGEISFPGGLLEDGEEPAAAALREAEEELAIPARAVEMLGALPPVHTTVSGILVVPFVGLLRDRPEIVPNAAEVEEVLEVPVERLASIERVVELEREGRRFDTYLFDVDGAIIWGATGRMLHDFLEIVR